MWWETDNGNSVFPGFIDHNQIFGVWIMTTNNQQGRLTEVNKIIAPFSKYIRLNPTTCMASRNWARRCSIHKLLFHIFLGNTINYGTYVPVALIQATTLPMLERPLLSCPSCWQLYCACVAQLFPCFINIEYPVDWMINRFYFRFIDVKKNLATFSDVQPFTRAAEMPSGVLINITGCLFKKARSHFFPAADFAWLNGFFEPFLIANWKSMRFMSWRLSPYYLWSVIMQYSKFYSQAHWVVQFS